METLQFAKVRDVKSPKRGTSLSAGIDFFIPNDWNDGKPFVVQAHADVLIPTGIHVKVPHGYMLTAFNKSGIATKRKLVTGACVVDEDYQGEVHIHLINTSNWSYTVTPGEKIAQFILIPVSYAHPKETKLEKLYAEKTERGDNGFGSTGVE